MEIRNETLGEWGNWMEWMAGCLLRWEIGSRGEGTFRSAKRKNNEPVWWWHSALYVIWWEGKTVSKKALTKLFGRNLSSFSIRYRFSQEPPLRL
jgi:hypothetical protein